MLAREVGHRLRVLRVDRHAERDDVDAGVAGCRDDGVDGGVDEQRADEGVLTGT